MASESLKRPIAPPRATMGALIDDLSRDYDNLPAVYDRNGQLTFAELNARSTRMARGLLAAGMAKGAHVGILMPNGADFLVALLAVIRIGGVAVLISTLARPRELALMIRNSDMDMLIAADAYLGNDYATLLETALPSLTTASSSKRLVLPEAPYLRSVWVCGFWSPVWSSGTESDLAALADDIGVGVDVVSAAQNEVVPADPCVVMYTSGSSADPKAIVHSQGNLVRQGIALGCLMGCNAGDRLLTTLPFFWVGGLCTAVLAAMCSGAAILCPDEPSTEATIACATQLQATHIMQWPQQIALMMDRPEFADAIASMRPAYAHQLSLFNLASAECTANTLGMTETLGPHSMFPLQPLPPDRAGSFGLAVGGIERRITDPETGLEQPTDAPGILSLRGGALMTGMLRTEHHDLFDADGFYRTDDICSISEDGHLFFHGRANDLVKVSGANVSPTEVESVIREEAGVKAAFVVGLPADPPNEILVAAIVAEDGVNLTEAALRLGLKAKLSSYKIPRRLVFLESAEIPMTATAKVYKPALKSLLAQRLADL